MNRYTFKAKRKDNGEWVYGFPIIYASGNIKITIPQCRKDLQETSKLVYGTYEIIPETLCQCTGLQDIDGNYIFENDIVGINTKHDKDKLAITYDNNNMCFSFTIIKEFGITKISYRGMLEMNNYDMKIRIIGNKFDKEVE